MTQSEFLEKCEQLKLPLEQMHIAVGRRETRPKCYGIYQETDGDWVLYKIKADGTFVEHYRGNEDTAFQQLYDKTMERVASRRRMLRGGGNAAAASASGARSPYSSADAGGSKTSSGCLGGGLKMLYIVLGTLFGIGFIVSMVALFARDRTKRGYYRRDNEVYYYVSGDWYWYDDDAWFYIAEDPGDMGSYYYGEDFYGLGVGSSWEDSGFAESYNSSDYDDSYDDSSDDWDDWDDDWDSGSDSDWGDDWDSDW